MANADQLRREHPIVFGRLYEAAARAVEMYRAAPTAEECRAMLELEEAILRAKEWIDATQKCE